ncbi:DUF6270 domain-containing protein [Alteromonas stellipolaris]|uniref:DUF6270 domain-containing protein n=1 Tax=Alteromonas stellipolaris TaxID=233316 RepID=UPI0027357053|nr:DUF6270 domain-containing protein [Alteromonas stellipolaris]MDP2597671.1 DUF6270 domain-containing protein [Alteromonas stellipolaris]
MKNVRILGSCVTRDALEITTDFKLIDYTARTSLASLATKSRKDSKLLNNVKSTFQKRMVERDMTKRFWLSLEKSQNDIIVIDLIDDRFNLKLFDDDSSHTVSSEYKTAMDSQCQNGRIVKSSSGEFKSLWETGLRRLKRHCDELKLDKVFVNCVFYQPTGNHSIDSSTNIAEKNQYLREAYLKLEDAFGRQAMIEYPEGIIKADADHKWGLAPFHFTTETYKFFLSELLKKTS